MLFVFEDLSPSCMMPGNFLGDVNLIYADQSAKSVFLCALKSFGGVTLDSKFCFAKILPLCPRQNLGLLQRV